MFNKNNRTGLLLVLLFCLSLSLSACDLLKKGDSDVPADLPVMEQSPENAEIKRDEKGMTESERQHLAYGKEHWNKFITAMVEFGESMESYLQEIKVKATPIDQIQTYKDSRDKLYKAARFLEAVDPTGIPESFKPAYAQMVVAANRARYMLSQIQQQNAYNLPDEYNNSLPFIDGIREQVVAFFDKVDAEGLAAAQGMVPNVDWAAEESREIKNREVFNVFDLGIRWGANRYEVMGVEGMQADAMSKEELVYPVHVYQYDALRKYHFNEYGQLDRYVYELDPHSFDDHYFDGQRYVSTGDPLLDDLNSLSAVVAFHFVPDQVAEAQPLQDASDGSGDLVVVFDQPAEVVELRGNTAIQEGPILITVSGKNVE